MSLPTLQGKTKADFVANRKGEGQLLLAMLAAFFKAK